MIAIFSVLPLALVFPFVGVLLWAWTSFSSIHRETFGLAADFSFNYYIAATTLAAWLISTEPKTLPNQLLPFLAIALAIWMSLSTYYAIDHPTAYELWLNYIKTMVLVIVVIALTTTKLRIQAFVWIIVLSIGYYAVKGGGFMLLTGSVGSRVFGPPDSMIADNNNLSLAMVMTIPLLNYLRASSRSSWVRAACIALMALTVIATIGTYSRGGFIGLVIVGGALLISSRQKMVPIITAIGVVVAVLNFAPGEWFERIRTIQTYEQDSSSVGRLNSWQTAWNLAQDRPVLGGGFAATENLGTYRRYAPPGDDTDGRAAHSIYFQVLGDLGFVGLALYLAMLAAGVYNLVLIQRWTAGHDELEWANMLARMMLVATMGFVTAGALLSMAYYDVFLCMLGLTVALRQVVRSSVAAMSPDTTSDFDPAGGLIPAWRRASR